MKSHIACIFEFRKCITLVPAFSLLLGSSSEESAALRLRGLSDLISAFGHYSHFQGFFC